MALGVFLTIVSAIDCHITVVVIISLFVSAALYLRLSQKPGFFEGTLKV